MKIQILLSLVYTITILFEYLSVSSSLKRSNDMAKEKERIPLDNVIKKQMALGYSLELIFGLLFLELSYELTIFFISNVIAQYLVFIVLLVVFFVLRNILYSTLTNLYIHREAKKAKLKTLEKLSNIPDSPQVNKDLLRELSKEMKNKKD